MARILVPKLIDVDCEPLLLMGYNNGDAPLSTRVRAVNPPSCLHPCCRYRYKY